MTRGAYLLNLGLVPYAEAFELQRSLAGAVSQDADPGDGRVPRAPAGGHDRPPHRDRERAPHPGRRSQSRSRDRSRGKSTFHGPGQLVCYPILDLGKHGKDVKRYVCDLEEALIRTLAASSSKRALRRPHWRVDAAGGGWAAKIASIGVHVARWVTTHGYALNVDLDPAPFTSGSRPAAWKTRRSRPWRASWTDP
jgi:lipoyl(octanoyl) transferase